MNKIKYFTLFAFVLGSTSTFAAKDSTFDFQNSVRVGYDDNIYQTRDANRQETAFITDIANITGTLTFSDRSDLELYWQPEFRYRFDADPEFVSYQDLYARFSHALTQRMFLEISDRFRYQEKDGQSDLRATVDQNFIENDLLGALSYTLNSVSQIKVGGGYEFRTWDDDAYGEGTGIYTDRANNYDMYKADGSYLRELGKDTTIGSVGINYQDLTYEGTRGGFDSTTLYGGVDHNFNPKMLATAQLGYSFSTVESSNAGVTTDQDTSSPFLQAGLDYSSSDRTTYTGSLGYSLRQSQNSYYNAANAFDVSLGARHDLTGKISLTGTLAYIFSMYDSEYTSLGLPDAEEKYIRLGLRGSYQINRNNFLDLGYEFTQRDTGQYGALEYTRNRCDFGWRLRF